MIEVWKCGTDVVLSNGLKGKISAICIRRGHITYEVVWWSDTTRNSNWLDQMEFTVGNGDRESIGYKN